VLIGGFAAAVHGSTLVTQYIDICAASTEGGVAKLREALKDLHPWHRMNPTAKLSFLEYPAEISGTKNIYLKTDLGVVDILSEVPPAGDFAAIKSRAIEIPLYGYKCKVISISDLIRVKEAMNRPKDQQAVRELKVIQRTLEPGAT
jgi:hypothetical protein